MVHNYQDDHLLRNIFFCSIALLIVIASSCSSRKIGTHAGENTPAGIALKYAVMMGVKQKDISNGPLYTFIDQWYGTPYQLGGLSSAGIDCSGFVFLLQKEVYGHALPRTTGQQAEIVKRKYENNLQEGDLVFFDYDGKRFSHVGVYLQNGFFVHASERRGVIVSNLHDAWTYRYFSRAGELNQ